MKTLASWAVKGAQIAELVTMCQECSGNVSVLRQMSDEILMDYTLQSIQHLLFCCAEPIQQDTCALKVSPDCLLVDCL